MVAWLILASISDTYVFRREEEPLIKQRTTADAENSHVLCTWKYFIQITPHQLWFSHSSHVNPHSVCLKMGITRSGNTYTREKDATTLQRLIRHTVSTKKESARYSASDKQSDPAHWVKVVDLVSSDTKAHTGIVGAIQRMTPRLLKNKQMSCNNCGERITYSCVGSHNCSKKYVTIRVGSFWQTHTHPPCAHTCTPMQTHTCTPMQTHTYPHANTH